MKFCARSVHDFEVLTSREREILSQIAQGRLNKQIAGDLGITETTVKVHRSNAMRKINAASLTDLCRMVDKLKLLPDKSEPWRASGTRSYWPLQPMVFEGHILPVDMARR